MCKKELLIGQCFNHCSQTKYGWFPANILAQQIPWRLLSIRQIWWRVAYVEKTTVQNSVSHEGSNCHRCQGCDCSIESLSRTLRGREIDAIWLSRIWAALTRNIWIDSVLIIQNYRWQPYIGLVWQKTLRRSRLAIPAIVCSFHICLCIYKNCNAEPNIEQNDVIQPCSSCVFFGATRASY